MTEVLAHRGRALTPEETEELLRDRLGDHVQRAVLEYGVLTLWLAPAGWLEAARRCRDERLLAYDMFDSLFGIDARDDGFDVVAVLYSTSTGNRIALRARCDGGRDAPALPSIAEVYRGADWMEREAYDMFGIDFPGHPGLEPRLLTVENFEGWPLRKDFHLASRVAKPWPGVAEPVELDEEGNKIERARTIGDAPGPYELDKAMAEQARVVNAPPAPAVEAEQPAAAASSETAASETAASAEVEGARAGTASDGEATPGEATEGDGTGSAEGQDPAARAKAKAEERRKRQAEARAAKARARAEKAQQVGDAPGGAAPASQTPPAAEVPAEADGGDQSTAAEVPAEADDAHQPAAATGDGAGSPAAATGDGADQPAAAEVPPEAVAGVDARVAARRQRQAEARAARAKARAGKAAGAGASSKADVPPADSNEADASATEVQPPTEDEPPVEQPPAAEQPPTAEQPPVDEQAPVAPPSPDDQPSDDPAAAAKAKAEARRKRQAEARAARAKARAQQAEADGEGDA